MCVGAVAAVVFGMRVNRWFALEAKLDSRCGLRTKVVAGVLGLGKRRQAGVPGRVGVAMLMQLSVH